VYAFAAAVKATAPRLVLPCDDTALRLLMLLAIAPPQDMQPELKIQLQTLVNDSLGDPAFYRTSIDKTQISAAAEAMGIPVPAHRVVSSLDEAEPFIAAHGFPLVVKRSQSTAGDGVAICKNRDELSAAVTRLTRPGSLDFGDSSLGSVVLQAHVPGRIHFYVAAAWKGDLLAGFAVEKLEGEPMGPTTASRYFRSKAMHELTARLARGFGLTGIFSPEFIVREGTGEPVLLELNRRMSHGTHIGSGFDVDIAAALYSAIHGLPPTSRAELDDGEVHLRAHFPAEWIRDAGSRWLRELRVDIPWDEPELFQALVEEGRRRLHEG
jgi:biotin carboxylase